ncbi:MAG TPA: MDR family MFS transporter [Nocardioides sp.]|nr:MDR family MFS transporter [Nocardioides sp.]
MTTSSAPRVARSQVGLRSERGPILLAVMLSVGLVAIDSTILATAVPSVVADLGGFTSFPWLFSIYLLAQAVSVPVYGKLADLYGRKPMMLVGVGLFVVGSLLCGIAWGMTSLIVFRLVQGLGAGAIGPIGMTIIGDIYTLQERATVQGYMASVWATAALVGPTLGGVFSDTIGWRWIFFVNLPLGAAAAWVLWRRFDENVARKRHRIDYLGSSLLAVGGTLLLLALLEGGVEWAWDSALSILLFAGAAVVLVGFVTVERVAAEPVLPLWIFRMRVLNVTNAGSLVVGILLMGLSSYVPLYAQRVLGTGALVAGLALAAMTIGWPVAAATAGRLYLTIGFRATLSIGAFFSVVGALILLSVDASSSVWYLAFACFVLGLGFGYVASPGVVAAQTAVSWSSRGVATSANMFSRSVGSAVGVAVFGAVVNSYVSSHTGNADPNIEHLSSRILDPAINDVYLATVFITLALLVVGFLMPTRVHEPDATAPTETPVDADPVA